MPKTTVYWIQNFLAVNMSQLKNISLNIETLPVASSDCYFILDLYAVQYNQLHIVNGIGGLKWSH